MRLKHAQTNHEKRSRNKVFLLLSVMVLALASCNAQEISKNMRTNIAANVSATQTSVAENYGSTKESIPKQIRDSILQINYSDPVTGEHVGGGGTGLATDIVKDVDGNSWVIMITANHVINDNQDVTLATEQDEMSFKSHEHKSQLIYPDIAISAFKLDDDKNIPSTYQINGTRSFDDQTFYPFSTILALGYANGVDGNGNEVSQNSQFLSGMTYLKFENGLITAHGTASAGMSGCPVFDINFNLIGFLSGFNENLGDLVFQNPSYIRIQPFTQELLDQYKIFVEGITGPKTQ